ncbi:ATP-dependent DNA ligase [Microbacterium sp. NPDC091313]
MGKLTFDNAIKVEFEDRLLAHLQHVISAKLRRDESFLFTWKEDVSVGGGRTAVWVHSHSGIVYKFHGGRSPALNPAWLHALSYTAAGPHGLYVVPEPDAHAVDRLSQQRPAMTFDVIDDEATERQTRGTSTN